jgi:hypothetical protein
MYNTKNNAFSTPYCSYYLCVNGRKGNIKTDLQEVGWGAWTELISLRIGTDGGLLKMW